MSAIPAGKTLNKLEFLKLMMLSREGDRREGILLRQSKGWFQVGGLGHEAMGALAYLLREDDYIFPFYRSRGLMLARGVTNYDLALAYFAKRGSKSGGRNMPAHFSDRSLNCFSVPTPTGANLLPAAGAAWGMKLEGKDTVAIASVGDASSRQGEFYEAAAFAIQEKLPLVLIIEDNQYGISTPTEKYNPMHLEIFNKAHIIHCNGRTPDSVMEAGGAAIDRARRGEGATILWAEVDRLGSHTSSDDHRVYRDIQDIEEMQQRDPIRLLAEELIASGEITRDDLEQIKTEIERQVDEDYLRAEKDEDPRADEVELHNFGKDVPAEAPPIQAGRQTMVTAINNTFRKALENDPKIVFFGEDIEDPKGGVFGITKGLSDSFPKQVFNSPLAECTILGIAVGLAAYGMRPCFELQFTDFMSPGWNQVVTNLSTLRWRSFGEWTCPAVIYAPYGAYLPGGGMWHSQSNESLLTHTTGLRVAIPSNAEDAAGLLWSAIHGDDPTFILIPKHLFRMQREVKDVVPVPFGKARIMREGSDVTLVTWGNCTELAEEAANAVAGECSVEVIDLRSLVPCDWDAIKNSIRKTGRLVVVHEDNRSTSFGQHIISQMVSDPHTWDLFLSPPQHVARLDVQIGYNPIYEYAALPSTQQVIDAIRVTM
ncbi:MAG: thiamine pyrophosphate-dependent enzyme [Fimbriimonadales bacterium]